MIAIYPQFARRVCPTSKRGHTWTEITTAIAKRLGIGAPHYLAYRVCSGCSVTFGIVDHMGCTRPVYLHPLPEVSP